MGNPGWADDVPSGPATATNGTNVKHNREGMSQ